MAIAETSGETRRASGSGVVLKTGGIAALLFASTFIIMVGCVVAPGLPVIAAHLGMERHPGWLVTLPALGVVLFGPAAGWIAARGVSSRTAMLGALIAYGILGLAAPLLHESPLLVVADRILLGAATAILMASTTGLVAGFFHGAARLKMIAWLGMATEGGGILLLAAGGALGAINWQLPFGLYALAFVCFVCVLFLIPPPPPIDEELAVGAPLNSRGVSMPLASATLSMMLFFVAVLTLPGTLARSMGLGAAGTGYVLSYISLCAVLCIGLLPKALRHVRPGYLQSGAFLLYGTAHFILARSRDWPLLLVAGATMGCAFAFSIPLSTHLVVELSPIAQRARNLGYLSTCIFLGQVLSSFASYVSTSGQRVMMVAGYVGISLAGLRCVREMTIDESQTAS